MTALLKERRNLVSLTFCFDSTSPSFMDTQRSLDNPPGSSARKGYSPVSFLVMPSTQNLTPRSLGETYQLCLYMKCFTHWGDDDDTAQYFRFKHKLRERVAS